MRSCFSSCGFSLGFSEIPKIGFLQGCPGNDSFIWIILDKALKQLHQIWLTMRNEAFYASALLLWKVEVHVRSIALEFPSKELLGGRAENIMNLLDLIHFVLPRKK